MRRFLLYDTTNEEYLTKDQMEGLFIDPLDGQIYEPTTCDFSPYSLVYKPMRHIILAEDIKHEN